MVLQLQADNEKLQDTTRGLIEDNEQKSKHLQVRPARSWGAVAPIEHIAAVYTNFGAYMVQACCPGVLCHLLSILLLFIPILVHIWFKHAVLGTHRCLGCLSRTVS